ncbi:PREDICTED: RNA-binding protein 12B-A-like [Cyprinodon variegatus]|uniref:RNA binding motif protein 12Bb n=1 Tax=Cyprinodon variegatus TaxID=28743 RepID=A0A3Q2GHC3_CYPVA|nr:PREDICTED: RNA-binding protein 12B-A-like [Cyprinodon variegatus]
MAVVIRLQGLSVTAESADIRRFFTGLKIPDGGVHIIGGPLEEAFIIFASDEDARRAIARSGGFINGSPVRLLLSSKQEMQSVLERATQKANFDQMGRPEGNGRATRRSMESEVDRRSRSRSGYSPPSLHQRPSVTNPDPFIVFLNGMPFSVTEQDVYKFFHGLCIVDIILCKHESGQNNGKGFAKFASKEDTLEALKHDGKYMGSRYVDVRQTTADFWRKAAARRQAANDTMETFERGRAPVRNRRTPEYQARSRSPVAPRPVGPNEEEYCVLLDNLSFAVEKDDIRHLFRNAKLENDQILFLTDDSGRRTRSAFVLFKSISEYWDAISKEKVHFLNRWIHIRSISRENMIRLLESKNEPSGSPGNSENYQERPSSSFTRDPYDSEKICAFVRNLPFDVRKVEIIDFFNEFNVTENMVRVLYDHKGEGVGQALVLFESEREAMGALSLNGRRFLGSEVAVKCITRAQMDQLSKEQPEVQQALPKTGQNFARNMEPYYGSGENASYSDMRKPREGSLPIQEERIRGGYDSEPRGVRAHSPRDRRSGGRGRFGAPTQQYDGPTCVQLVNLPFQIRTEEVYDFCYGYRIIPGSVSLQYEASGKPKGSATLVFESRQEALTAIRELSGRPIGPRKIQLILV